MPRGRWYRSGESSLDRCCAGKGKRSGLENSLSFPLRTKDGFGKDAMNFYTLLGDGGEKKTMQCCLLLGLVSSIILSFGAQTWYIRT